jgi:hypothetical protein
LWLRGNVSWDLKFIVLTVYTVVFLFLLSWWNQNWCSGSDPPFHDSGSSGLSTPWGMASIAALVIAGALQFREIRLPILSGPDEPYRIAAAIDQWQAITAGDAGIARTAVALASPVLLWLAGLILLSKWQPVLKRVAVGCGLLAAGFTLNHQMMFAVGTRWGESPRWPPLGTLLEVFSFSVFGLGEASARVPSLVFFILTGVFLFRLVARDATPLVAFAAVISVLSSTAFFTQGQLASRETAGAFFMTAAAFFLVRWWHFGRDTDLGLSIALTLAAYLTRRPSVVFAVVIVAVVVMRVWEKRRAGELQDVRHAVVQPVLGIVILVSGAFPWMFATRTIRPFELSPSNWFDWTLIAAYPSQFPGAMGLVVTAFGAAGIVIATFRRRILALMALVWLAVVYVLFTSDVPRWIPTWRFIALMSPAWAVLAAEGFRFFHKRLPKWAQIPYVAFYVIGAVGSIVMWSSPAMFPPWLPNTLCRGDLPRYPFDQVVAWIAENEPQAVVITPATYWQTSLDVNSIFMGMDRIEEYVPSFGRPAPPLNAHDVTEICRTTPADLVVIPYRQDGDVWIPLFMAPEDASRLALVLGLGSSERMTFTRGTHRLDLYVCPHKSGSQ